MKFCTFSVCQSVTRNISDVTSAKRRAVRAQNNHVWEVVALISSGEICAEKCKTLSKQTGRNSAVVALINTALSWPTCSRKAQNIIKANRQEQHCSSGEYVKFLAPLHFFMLPIAGEKFNNVVQIAYLTYFTSLWDIFSDTWLQLSFQVYPGQPTCSV